MQKSFCREVGVEGPVIHRSTERYTLFSRLSTPCEHVLQAGNSYSMPERRRLNTRFLASVNVML